MMEVAMPTESGILKTKLVSDITIVWAETLTGPKGLSSRAISAKQEHSTEDEMPRGRDSLM